MIFAYNAISSPRHTVLFVFLSQSGLSPAEQSRKGPHFLEGYHHRSGLFNTKGAGNVHAASNLTCSQVPIRLYGGSLKQTVIPNLLTPARMQIRFHILSPDPTVVETLSRALGFHPAAAAVLANRGLSTPDTATDFLHCHLGQLRSPSRLKDMDKAVRRIHKAIENHERVLIFGDYDADGVTATALLYDFFRQVGADVSYYVPHRGKEGYGLSPSHIERLAIPKGVNLIVTVDCGSTSHAAVDVARDAGIDVIVTDHHLLPTTPPPAEAVINPMRTDCRAGFDGLAGVGVAFTLLICLRQHLRSKGFWENGTEPNLKSLCDLVAIGTVADIVPLRGENRIFTRTGIAVINRGDRPGLTALQEAAGIGPDAVTAEDIAFRLAPRINAAGRMAHAASAIRLLTTRDAKQAHRIAGLLNRLNRHRQSAEQAVLAHILGFIRDNPQTLQQNAMVFQHPDWHEGILGIVAAKLVARYYRPVILISLRNGIGKGSGRSIPGFHLLDGLKKTSDHLVRFGGHAMAAGLTIEADAINAFRRCFEATVTEKTRPDDFIPQVAIDRVLRLEDITPVLISQLETLQPFGPENPEPLFLAHNITVSFSRIVGGRHRQLKLTSRGASPKTAFNAIQFNVAPDETPPTVYKDVAFRLRWNRWNGRKSIQLLVEHTA